MNKKNKFLACVPIAWFSFLYNYFIFSNNDLNVEVITAFKGQFSLKHVPVCLH